MIQDNTYQVTKELFEAILYRYQIRLETSIEGSDFIIDCIDMLQYKHHRINLNCNGSYTDFPNQINTEKATINLANDDKCCQYATTVPLNHEETGKKIPKNSKTGKE